MDTIMETAGYWYDRLTGILNHFDGVASLMMRLILGPVLIGAGWGKLTGENWFGFQLESFPFPFNVLPADLSWFLASWTEFLGGIALLLGLGTRLVAIPLAVTMFVAAYAVHLDNGWAAVAPSNPPGICIAGSEAHAASNVPSTASGVPNGATTILNPPYITSNPNSWNVGTSGTSSLRSSAITASTRSAPAATYDMAAGRLETIASTSPPRIAANWGPEPPS